MAGVMSRGLRPDILRQAGIIEVVDVWRSDFTIIRSISIGDHALQWWCWNSNTQDTMLCIFKLLSTFRTEFLSTSASMMCT